MLHRALLSALCLHLLLLALPLTALPEQPQPMPSAMGEAETEPPTDLPAEAPAPTEPPTEAPTQPETEPPTEGVTEASTQPETEPATEEATEESVEAAALPETVTVLLSDGSVEEMELEDYLWGVVAAEMPASFAPEALKAQAVAARSYTCWQMAHGAKAHPQADVCTDYGCCQAWLSRQERLERWPEEDREALAEKITEAVTATAGETLVYQGEPALAVFHASTAGQTRSAEQVWGQAFPYLIAVDSPEGEGDAPNYYSVVTVPEQEVREKLSALAGELGPDRETWLTPAGEDWQAGTEKLTAQQVRTLFGLRSAAFTVQWGEEGLSFYVTGYGHGVGMSQYGANVMAKAGSDYREILAHYYPGTTIS